MFKALMNPMFMHNFMCKNNFPMKELTSIAI